MTTLVSPEDRKKEEMFERNQNVSDVEGGPTTGFLDRVQSSFMEGWAVSNINSRMRVKNNLYGHLKSKAEDVLDEKVPNPLNPEFEVDSPKDAFFNAATGLPPDFLTRLGRFSGGIPFLDTGISVADEKDIDEFFKKMDKAHQKTGNDIFNIDREEFEQTVSSKQAEIEEGFQKTVARFGGNPVSGFTADLIGSMPAVLADPWDLATLPIGATSSTRVLGSKVLGSVLTEAGVEGLVELSQQPDIQDIRQKAGLQTSSSRMVINTLAAAGGAGVLGGSTRIAGIKLNDYIDSLSNQKMAKDVSQQLVRRGVPITEVDTARRVLEMNDYMRRTNPFDASDYSKSVANLGTHLSNVKRAQEGLLRGSEFEIDDTPMGQRVPEINRKTEPIPVERIDTTQRATNLDEPDESVRPIFYEDEEGNLKIIEGTDDVATGMQKGMDEIKGTVLKASKGIDEGMAEKFVAGKRYEEGRISRDELASILGKSEETLLTPQRSNFVKDGTAIRDQLSDEAFLKMKTDEGVDFHIASEVARQVDEANQVKALELTKDAQTKAEARLIIDRAKNNNFESVDPLEALQTRDAILQQSIKKLKQGKTKLTYSDGSEVDVDDEFLAGLRKLSRSGGGLSEALNRQSKATGESPKPEALESAADEYLAALQEKLRSGDISRDAIRSSGGLKGSRTARERALSQRNFVEDAERPDVSEQIQNGELREIEEYRQTIEENDLENMEIPSLREGEETMTVKEAMDVIEEDRKALDELRDCAV